LDAATAAKPAIKKARVTRHSCRSTCQVPIAKCRDDCSILSHDGIIIPMLPEAGGFRHACNSMNRESRITTSLLIEQPDGECLRVRSCSDSCHPEAVEQLRRRCLGNPVAVPTLSDTAKTPNSWARRGDYMMLGSPRCSDLAGTTLRSAPPSLAHLRAQACAEGPNLLTSEADLSAPRPVSRRPWSICWKMRHQPSAPPGNDIPAASYLYLC